MQAIIKPGFLRGTIAVPPSKSMMQRACAGALLHKGVTTISNPGFSNDDKVALGIIEALGATVLRRSEQEITIQSDGVAARTDRIFCGESGLSARLFVPIAALEDKTMRIEGEGSLLVRPMQDFKEVLPGMGVQIEGFSGYIPFTLKGPLQPKSCFVEGSTSSQFLTGLLFACCYAAKSPLVIEVANLASKPYIDLTLEMLSAFGRHVRHEHYERFIIDPSAFEFRESVMVHVASDWSSASYWIAGGAIGGGVSLHNLDMDSLQADRQIITILKAAGGLAVDHDNVLQVIQSELKPFEVDLSDAPDLFPIVAIIAARSNGKSRIKGLHRLKHKESDRAHSITEMLHQFGVQFDISNDALTVEGKPSLNAAMINGYNDHRIVMAAAIGALAAQGDTVISHAEAVAKSYPDFFNHLRSLGIQCELKN